MAMDGPAEWAPDGNVTCHLFTCVMVKSTNGDVMGTKSDTRPMHNLPTVATTARIHPWVLGRPRLRLRFQPQTLGWSLGLRTSRVVVGATTSAGSVARGRGPCLSDGAGSALAWHPVYGSGSAGAECSQRVLAGLVHRQLAIEGGQLECAALRPLRTGNRELAPRVVQAAEGV